MAVINALAEQYDSSARFAHLVADAKLPATPSQRGFATYLLICLDDTVAPAAPAAHLPAPQTIDQRYLQLTKAYPDAPWLDEVIYRLAARNDKSAKSATTTDPTGRDFLCMTGKVDESLFTDDAASTVPQHYRALVERYPQSPRVDRACWRLGRLWTEQGDDTDAQLVLAQLVKDRPDSPYAGDAFVRLIDVSLESRFDLPAAEKLVVGAIQWDQAQKKPQPDAATLEPWRLIGNIPNLPASEFVTYEIYLRAGLIAYFNEDFPASLTLFQKAGLKPPDAQGNITDISIKNIGLNTISAVAKRQIRAWDSQAAELATTDAQRTAIKLGDSYLHAQRTDKAIQIFERLMAGDPVFGRISPQIKAYCTYRLALSYSVGRVANAKVVELYSRFYKPPLSQTPWAASALIRLGVVAETEQHDMRAACRHYVYVAQHYPQHQDAERALYYSCVGLMQLKDYKPASDACKEFLQRYANSPNYHFRDDIVKRLRQLQSTPLADLEERKGKGKR